MTKQGGDRRVPASAVDEDEAFAGWAQKRLRHHESALDGALAARLAEARRAAVAAAGERQSRNVRWFWWPAVPLRWMPAGMLGAMAMVLIAAVLVWSPSEPPMPRVDDHRALQALQDLDLLENLEFIAWVLEQEKHGEG